MFTISLQVGVKEEFKETGVLEENPSWVGKLWLPTQTDFFPLTKCREFPGGPWLRLHAFIAEGMCSIPGWGAKILEAM